MSYNASQRTRLTKRQRIDLWILQDGKCGCGCGKPINWRTAWDEHWIPREFFADARSEALRNRRLVLKDCALRKTAEEDLPAIAKSNRLRETYVNGGRKKPKGRPIPSRPFPQHQRPMQSRGFQRL